MTLIILSKENWRAAKAELHQSLPHVRSSHLAEAMAAAVGEHTHIGLSRLLQDSDARAQVRIVNASDFAIRLQGFGYRPVDLSSLDRAFSSADLPHRAYAAFRSGDRAANDRHYHQCNALSRPMMMVRTARKYAELEWDGITVDPNEEDYLHGDAGTALARIMFNLFQACAKGAPGKPIFCGSAFTGTVKRLLPETAYQLAEDYFRLLYSPLLEPRGPRQRAA